MNIRHWYRHAAQLKMNLWMNQSACAGYVSMETPQNQTPDLGLAINFCSMVQQHFSNACPVILCSQVQRCETILVYKHTQWVKLLLFPNFYALKGVGMFTLLPILTLACLLSSKETRSTLPSCAARWRGLMPWRVTVLHSAPYSSNVVPISNWFFLAAMWRGV